MVPIPVLGELPEEILIQIISQLPQDALVSIAPCSTRLHRLASAELYSTVYFEDAGSKAGLLKRFATRALNWEESENCYVATRQRKTNGRRSRILNLSLFLNIIEQNSNLRSLIATAALEGTQSEHAKSLYGEGIVQAKLRPSESLHLAFGHYEIEKPLGLPVKSLSLHHSREVCDIDYLHSLFSIPTLRWLNISGLRWSQPLQNKDDVDRSRTSAVNKLSFPSSAPSADDFAEFLTWPKALKELSFEASSEGLPQHPQMRRLRSLLKPQKETLEKISLSGESLFTLLSYNLLYGFFSFLALKRLSIRADWLQLASPSVNSGSQAPSIWNVLPLNLVQLQLETPIILNYCCMRQDGNVDEPHLTNRRECLVASLRELADEKLTRQLNIEEVAVWFRRRDDLNTILPGNNGRRAVDYQELIYACLYPKKGTTERIDLDNDFENAGCKLSLGFSVEPPLFDI